MLIRGVDKLESATRFYLQNIRTSFAVRLQVCSVVCFCCKSCQLQSTMPGKGFLKALPILATSAAVILGGAFTISAVTSSLVRYGISKKKVPKISNLL